MVYNEEEITNTVHALLTINRIKTLQCVDYLYSTNVTPFM